MILNYLFLGGLSMRLRGTIDSNRGRLEAYRPGYGWYTVCDHHWEIYEAHVACREMGFNGASAVYHDAHYGRGSTGYILDFHPSCSGTESSLFDCPRPWNDFWGGKGSCGSNQHVGLDCRLPDEN